MKIKHYSPLIILFVMFAQTAFAYMEFTYNAQDIAWRSAFLYGNPDRDLGADDLPSFTLTFQSEQDTLESTGLTIFSILNPIVNITPDYITNLVISPSSHGTLSLNPDGSINSWNFIVSLSSASTVRQNPRYTLTSKAGKKTCNCDTVKFQETLWAQTTQEHWIKLGPMEINYQDINEMDNWTIKNITKVSEPVSWPILIFGLAFFGFLRRKCIKVGVK